MEERCCYLVLDEMLKRALKTVVSWLYGPRFLAPDLKTGAFTPFQISRKIGKPYIKLNFSLEKVLEELKRIPQQLSSHSLRSHP